MVIAVLIVALIGMVVLKEDQEMTAKSGPFWSLGASWYRKLPFSSAIGGTAVTCWSQSPFCCISFLLFSGWTNLLDQSFDV
ncbi:hypothetical protein EUGRSUZ_L00198 [Eucalyptus grandis]|uniref:Uncharacterized protein n=1 Tax=Eucalyptus grandis TaxID=71139 RepID=A0A058ZX80_EUCGR|nr:hypothetical protein EUGRSUZ_L00198 [Eucalyptus grandis]